MLETYLTSGKNKLTVATQAAKSAIDSLNPNDKVRNPLSIILNRQWDFRQLLDTNYRIYVSIYVCVNYSKIGLAYWFLYL